MSEYKLVKGFDGVQRTSDMAFIPNAPGNSDWSKYQEWFNNPENTPDPAQTLEEIKLDRIQEIKSLASSTILGSFSDVKQRNLLAMTNELLLKKMSNTMTSDDELELIHVQAIWDWVKLIRSNSNSAEVLVNAATDKISVEAVIFTPSSFN